MSNNIYIRLNLSENEHLPQQLQKSTYLHESTQALLHEIAVVAEKRYDNVRCGVTTWLVLARRLEVVKDIRLLIGVQLWSTREDVEWEMRDSI